MQLRRRKHSLGFGLTRCLYSGNNYSLTCVFECFRRISQDWRISALLPGSFHRCPIVGFSSRMVSFNACLLSNNKRYLLTSVPLTIPAAARLLIVFFRTSSQIDQISFESQVIVFGTVIDGMSRQAATHLQIQVEIRPCQRPQVELYRHVARLRYHTNSVTAVVYRGSMSQQPSGRYWFQWHNLRIYPSRDTVFASGRQRSQSSPCYVATASNETQCLPRRFEYPRRAPFRAPRPVSLDVRQVQRHRPTPPTPVLGVRINETSALITLPFSCSACKDISVSEPTGGISLACSTTETPHESRDRRGSACQRIRMARPTISNPKRRGLPSLSEANVISIILSFCFINTTRRAHLGLRSSKTLSDRCAFRLFMPQRFRDFTPAPDFSTPTISPVSSRASISAVARDSSS
eukprot:284818228_1